ncbi:MAG: hypothetical protein KAS32_00560 [Candidatus Peribacteraceae bacterium]|nr:hypothetical protein [Candidatus Peribacteraceae bacterium]
MAKKFVFYLKGVGRGIVITDPEDETTLDEVSKKVDTILSGKVVAKFSSENDALVVRSNEIIGVHIIDDEDKFKRVAFEDAEDSMNVIPEINLEFNEIEVPQEDIVENIVEDDNIPEDLLKEEPVDEDIVEEAPEAPVEFDDEEELPPEPEIPDDILHQADKINEEE